MKNKNWKLKILVFGLVLAWVFGGWPRLFKFPPSIGEAEASHVFVVRSRVADGNNRQTLLEDINKSVFNHDKSKLIVYALELQPQGGDKILWNQVQDTVWRFSYIRGGITFGPFDLTLVSSPAKLAGDGAGDTNMVNDTLVSTSPMERVVNSICQGTLTYEPALKEHKSSGTLYNGNSNDVTSSKCTETQALVNLSDAQPGDEFIFMIRQWYYNVGETKVQATEEGLARVFIANSSPAITANSVKDSPDPVNPDQTLTFELDWTNGDGGGGEITTAHFCKDDAVTSSSGGGSCTGGVDRTWADAVAAGGAGGHAVATRNIGAGDGSGQQNYYAFVCDNNGTIPACSSSVSGTFTITAADTTIDPERRWAWNDVIGWIDFCGPNALGNCTFDVDTKDPFTGRASSSVGFIALTCNNPDIGLDCTGFAEPWQVNIDANGKLSGWGWNSVIGWISFCGDESGGSVWNAGRWDCYQSGTPTYEVSIGADKKFHGWAWNDVVGWISFNCENTEGVGCTTYWVQRRGTLPTVTGVLTSSIFNTEGDGAQLNSLMWQGSQNGGRVFFEIATSDNANTWNFYGPVNGQPDSPDEAIPGVPLQMTDFQRHANRKYFRYRITLAADAGQSPLVDDIIINWSP